jgi:hypothetical protein
MRGRGLEDMDSTTGLAAAGDNGAATLAAEGAAVPAALEFHISKQGRNV